MQRLLAGFPKAFLYHAQALEIFRCLGHLLVNQLSHNPTGSQRRRLLHLKFT